MRESSGRNGRRLRLFLDMDASRDSAELERLLGDSAWLTALARSLAGDPTRADDLAQETWLAALRAPRALRNRRAWLATLARNLARSEQRSSLARKRREQAAAAPEAIEGPDALVERAEAQRRVLEAVLALDEPYRGAVLARYAEGRAPAQIARARGVNESTVRTWIARGLERLRERFARDRGERWALFLAPLAGPPGPGSAAGTGAVSAGAAAGIGALLMSTTVKSIAAAAGVVACAWWLWNGLGTTPIEPGRLPPTPTAVIELAEPNEPGAHALAPAERVPIAARAPADEAPEPAEPAAAAAAAPAIEIMVTRDGQPAPGVAVWAAPENDWPMLECLDLSATPPPAAERTVTGRDGLAVFEQPAAWRFRIGLDPTGSAAQPMRFVTQDLHGGYRHTVELGSGSIHGTAYDANGAPLAGAGVQVSHQRPDVHHTIMAALARTNVNGDYRVDDLPAADFDVVLEPDGRFDGRGEVQRRGARLARGAELQIDFGSPRGSPRWTGAVRNAFGKPFPGAGILELRDPSDELLRASATIDADGHFEIPHSGGAWMLRAHVAGAPGAGFELGQIELPDADVERDVVVPGARLRGRLLDRAGHAFEPRGGRRCAVSVRQKGHDYPSAFRDATLSADGRYTIDGLEPGTWLVTVHPVQLAQGEPLELSIAAGETVVELDLTLAVN